MVRVSLELPNDLVVFGKSGRIRKDTEDDSWVMRLR